VHSRPERHPVGDPTLPPVLAVLHEAEPTGARPIELPV
jgi:hypothetical protein